jgi:hypothetical protein
MVAMLVRRAVSLLVTAMMVVLGGVAEARQGNIRIQYAPPKETMHRSFYETLQKKRVLERVRDKLRGLHLPRQLTLRVEGCDGDINAAYDSSDTSLTICYEYLAYIQELAQNIPPSGLKEGLTPLNYVVGPLLEVLLHELAHAVFDLRKVPILGREEDAADQVAAFLLLRIGKGEVRRVIASIATMYASEAKDAPSKLKDFADEHGMPAQRLFNLLCINYGADRKIFGDLVDKGFLPKERAEQCDGEYRQVKFAFDRLIAPKLGNQVKAASLR